MTITTDRFLRELNGLSCLLLLIGAILCAVFSKGRGMVHLSFTMNNSMVETSPRQFDIGFIFVGMLLFTSISHAFFAYWPQRILQNLNAKSFLHRFILFSIIVPIINVAAVVGLGKVTDVFAVYAAFGLSSLFTVALWTCFVSNGTNIIIKSFFCIVSFIIYLTFWGFVWAQTVEQTFPLVLFLVGTVGIIVTCGIMWSMNNRPIVREAVLTNASVGLQLACATIWVSLHHDEKSTFGPMVALIVVAAIFVLLCVYATFRVSGIFLLAVDDDLLQDNLLKDENMQEFLIDDESENEENVLDPYKENRLVDVPSTSI